MIRVFRIIREGVMKLVGDGFVLLVLGQAMVFSFLGMLVITVMSTAWVVKRFFLPAPEPAPESIAVEADEEAALAAAIATAVNRYRASP